MKKKKKNVTFGLPDFGAMYKSSSNFIQKKIYIYIILERERGNNSKRKKKK